jgi:hypothetical protein
MACESLFLQPRYTYSLVSYVSSSSGDHLWRRRTSWRIASPHAAENGWPLIPCSAAYRSLPSWLKSRPLAFITSTEDNGSGKLSMKDLFSFPCRHTIIHCPRPIPRIRCHDSSWNPHAPPPPPGPPTLTLKFTLFGTNEESPSKKFQNQCFPDA